MELGAHLPLVVFRGDPPSIARLVRYAEEAESLGFTTLCANDHIAFTLPYLDSLSALAAVVGSTRHVTLMTTIALPVVRGPAQLAKALATLNVLSEGRVVAGLGPGSHRNDYLAAHVDFDERWPRFDESVRALRVLLGRDPGPHIGRFYSTAGITLEPLPSETELFPIWIGSWGSEVGLRRVARLGDGWLASAYNTTPVLFADRLAQLGEYLRDRRKDPAQFPNALATMFFHITDDANEQDQSLALLSKLLNRPPEHLRERLLIGSVEECAEKVRAFRDAGVQRLFVWPIIDEIHQLERLQMCVTGLRNHNATA